MLKLSHGHTMHYTEHGNPHGLPAIRIHGGPGSGSKPDHTEVFNLKTQRVILYDQRGCGQSTPLGETRHNTTQLLVEDLEALRKHLKIEKWQLVGFSWGSTLALAYAQKYPQRVQSIVTGAVFLATKPELDWFTAPSGAPMFFPKFFADACKLLPPTTPAKLPQAVLKALQSPNRPYARQVAEAFTLYDAFTMEFLPPDPAAVLQYMRADKLLATRMQIMWYYFANRCFLKPNQLLKNAHKLKNIPISIIQAQYDLCTPPAAAQALHAALPHSTLTMVTLAGHRATPQVTKLRRREVIRLAKLK